MPSKESENLELYLDDPRLKMTVGGRFVVRIISYISYLIVFFAMGAFLLSGSNALRALGFLLLLFLIDSVKHAGRGRIPIYALKFSGRVNVAKAVRPTVAALFGRVFDHGLTAKRDFYLTATARLLNVPHIEAGLKRLDVSPKEFRAKLDALSKDVEEDMQAGKIPRPTKQDYLEAASALAIAAFEEAVKNKHSYIGQRDVFSVLPTMPSRYIGRLFDAFGLEAGDLGKALIFSDARRALRRTPKLVRGFAFEADRRVRHRIMNRAWTARPTPTLDKFSYDYTDLAREGRIGFLIGHEAEYSLLVETLSRSVDPDVLLVAEEGVGVGNIVAHFALNVVKDNVPSPLFDRRVVMLQIEEVISGASQEELSLRLEKIVDEINKAGNIILCILNIHNLIRTSGAGYMSAADILLPAIQSGSFPVIGITSPKEFGESIEPRSDILGTFEVVRVNEISEDDAEKILTYESLVIERDNDIVVSFGAIKRAVSLAHKYFRNQRLPSSAIELLRSAVAKAVQQGEKTLDADFISKIAEEKTNIPLHEAEGEEADKLLHLEDIIHERLIDQKEAVSAIATALREYRAGVSRKGGPIASFLFVGPTGVGKTELAKILARVEFGSEKAMIRFDMTEYNDRQSFFRFIGTPDGSTHGELTEAVREKPFGVILLDEFEKAYPDILNLFLQVLDDGRLTDSSGRTVDFTNTIIIATSNAHSDIITESLSKGESISSISDYLKTRLVDVFKPELLNRFSKIVIFKELSPSDLKKIVAINLDELADSIKDEGITLDFDPSAIELLTKLGYEPQFGARPLRRVIDEQVRSLIAKKILEKKIGHGSRVKLVAVPAADAGGSAGAGEGASEGEGEGAGNNNFRESGGAAARSVGIATAEQTFDIIEE